MQNFQSNFKSRYLTGRGSFGVNDIYDITVLFKQNGPFLFDLPKPNENLNKYT